MDSVLFQAGGILTCLQRHIWNGCAQGTLALLLVYAVCRLYPRIPPHAASWLWRLAYLKLLIALLFVGSVPLHLPARGNNTPAVAVINNVLMNNSISNLTETTAHVAGKQLVAGILVLLWYVGIVASGTRLLAASQRTREMLHTCIEVKDPGLQAELMLLCSRIGIRRAPCLLSGYVDSPMVSGFITASIILPNTMLASSTHAELRLALAHELAHIRRRDVAWGWLPMLASWFFFFHPLVWILRNEWMVAQEASCDLLAIEATGAECVDYGRMLLGCAAQVRAVQRFATVGIVESHDTLRRRIQAMATLRNASRKEKITIKIAIGILAIVVIVPWMVGCSNSTEKVANALPRAMYARDLATFSKLNLFDKGHAEDEKSTFYLISTRVQPYGEVKSVRLEAKGKVLPGFNASTPGMVGLHGALPSGCDVSTWRVKAEHGEYRLILTTRDGNLAGCFFNLDGGCIGTGEYF